MQTSKKNMGSAVEQPLVLDEYIAGEAELGRLVKIDAERAGAVHCSPFGVIPKKGKKNKPEK